MPPSALDSTLNPSLEYVKYLKLFEIIQMEKCCAKEEDYLTKRDVERRRGEGPWKSSKGRKGASCVWWWLGVDLHTYCERNIVWNTHQDGRTERLRKHELT